MKIEKDALCAHHKKLIEILQDWGHGIALQPQLRNLCLMLGLYKSPQMFDRAVRSMKKAGLLKRQTAPDGNSDVLVACKHLIVWHLKKDGAQQVSSVPKRTTNTALYCSMFRLEMIIKLSEQRQEIENRPVSYEDICLHLTRMRQTFTMRIPELIQYFSAQRRIFTGNDNLGDRAYDHQMQLIQRHEQNRQNLAHKDAAKPLPEVPGMEFDALCLELLHRKGIFIRLIQKDKIVLCTFLFHKSAMARVIDRIATAYYWAQSLLPAHSVRFIIYVPSQSLKEQYSGGLTRNGYLKDMLRKKYVCLDHISVAINNLDFENKYWHGTKVIA